MTVTINGTSGIDSPDFEPTSSTVPTNGVFLPAANTVGIATNGVQRVQIDSTATSVTGGLVASGELDINGTGTSTIAGDLDVTGTVTANGTQLGSYTPPSWTYFTASGTYTVPANVTSIRGYAGGAGGNGASGTNAGGGGGGGFAFGNIAVTAGQTVTVTISSGVATLAIGATTYLTGNAGGNASSGTGGTAGTASIHASVTSGGAYSGGAGGSASGGNSAAGGGSCGSPLGNGYAGVSTVLNQNGPGAGIGGSGISDSAYGGGGGGAGGAGYYGGGGAGGPASGNTNQAGGSSRAFNARFTDPLLVNAVAPGGMSLPTSGNVGGSAGPGAGGGAGAGHPGNGGDFGGGGSCANNSGYAGNGGLMGGGAGNNTTSYPVGSGGLGGGGGGGKSYAGTGGGAFVFIYA